MGYLSFQIIVFLLLAAALGFIIGWLLRGSRFQTELQDLDGRWRTKLGEVEGERDRFVAELTQANDGKAKLEADLKRISDSHESSVQQLKREHQTKIASFADTEKLTAGLKSDLAARGDELSKAQAELADARRNSGDAGRLGKELAAASQRAATLEASLKEAKTANANCKSEVDRLKAEVADLRRAGGSSAGTAASGGAMGLMGSAGSSTSTSTSTGGGGQSGGSDTSFTQRAASPSQLAESGAQRFSSGGGQSGTTGTSASSSASKAADDDENEGVRPAALTAARGGQADDLKRISGVGPKLEKTLNGLGIYHFSQIAEFTPDNVAWVDRHLRFKGRIERENWIDQARVLAAGGETEFSKRQ